MEPETLSLVELGKTREGGGCDKQGRGARRGRVAGGEGGGEAGKLRDLVVLPAGRPAGPVV